MQFSLFWFSLGEVAFKPNQRAFLPPLHTQPENKK